MKTNQRPPFSFYYNFPYNYTDYVHSFSLVDFTYASITFKPATRAISIIDFLDTFLFL